MLTRYLLPALAVLAVGFALVRMAQAQHKSPPAAPPVEPAGAPFGAQLAGAGVVEPETENISIGTQLPGVVEEVRVHVGMTVRPGDPLFRLDGRQLRAELAARQAGVQSARAGTDKLARQPRAEEVPPSEAKVRETEANLRDQQKLWERAQRLGAGGSLSDEEYTRRELAVAVADAQVLKARADLQLLKAGAWQPDKDVAAAAVALAEAQADQARTDLDRLTVRAPRMRWPAGGVVSPGADADPTEFQVLQVNVRPGEYVGQQQGQVLIVLGTVGRLHVRVDIDENDIPRFRPGLPGVAKPRGGAGEAYPLAFVRVEPFVIPKKSLTGANTERVDTRVLQVIYAVTGAAGRPLYVGQQVDVFLDAGDNR